MRPQRQNYIVLNFQIVRIGQVFNLKKLFNFGNAFRRQIDNLVLFIDNKVAAFFLFDSHNGVNFGQIFHVRPTGHLSCQNIAGLIELRGLSALSGNNQRRPGFVDKNRVHFVNNGIMQISEHQLFFVNDHVVPQVIKPQFIIRHIRNVTAISLPPLFRLHGIQYHADSETQKLMYLPHPLGITFCQIVVDRYNMHTPSTQCIQIGGQCGYKGFSFACLHFCNTTLVQDNTTDQLYPEMLHIQNAPCRFAYYRIGFRKQIVQRLSLTQTLFKLLCLSPQSFVGKCLHIGPQSFDPVHQRCNPPEFAFAVGSKYFLYYIHTGQAPVYLL